MPFSRCITAALADQKLTQAEHDEYQEVFDTIERTYREDMTPHEAAAQAARDTFAYIEEAHAEARRDIFLALAARDDIMRRLDSFVSPFTGKNDPYAAAKAVMSRVVQGRGGEHSVEGQHDYWHGLALGHLDEAYTVWRRNMFGVRRQKPRLINVVRAAFGENTDDGAANELAAGWKRASEMLRQAFNRFGGHIDKLEDWGLPQHWDNVAVRRAGFAAFKADLAPELNRARMLDYRGGKPLDDARLDDVLHQVFQSIVTEGWAGREATSAGGAALANRRGQARVLHFKDADSWYRIAQKYGSEDPVDAMLSHIDHISRDVAAMQVLGPNPKAMLTFLKNEISRRHALEIADAPSTLSQRAREYLKDKAVATNDSLDAMFASYTHANAAPAHPILADIGDDIVNLATAAQIPGVVPMALVGDFNTARLTAKFNGIPFTLAMKEYLSHFNPLDAEHRALARAAGLEAQHYGRSLGSQGRFLMQINGHRWSRWISDRALAASGLTAHTAAGREAIGLAFYRQLARARGTAFTKLDPKFRDMLARGGIGKTEWDAIRNTTPHQIAAGVQYIRPGDVLDRADIDNSTALSLSGKIADIANTLAEYAVPSSTLQGRAAFMGQSRRGTWRHVLAQSTAMYHQYGTSMLLTHGLTPFAQTPRKGAAYAASLLVSMTLSAALAIQLKEIALGRDPRDMTDWRFWGNALAAGGGGGILGDFVYAGLQGDARTGKGLTQVLAGSPVGFVEDLANTTFGNPLGKAANHPSPLRQNYATGWLNFAKRYAPGSSMWYARLVLERYVWDQLQEQIDPGWKQRTRRIENWYRKQFGNEYYWHHGDVSPARAPDLRAVAGGSG